MANPLFAIPGETYEQYEKRLGAQNTNAPIPGAGFGDPTLPVPQVSPEDQKLINLGVTPDQIKSLNTPQGLDPLSFQNLIGNVETKLKLNNELVTERGYLVKHLYDSPLTPEELSKLPKDIQQVVQGGNKDNIELQLRLINDQISGRGNTLTQSIKYLTEGYQTAVSEAEKLRTEHTRQAEFIIKNTPSSVLRNTYTPAQLDTLGQSLGFPVGTLSDPNFKTDKDVQLEQAQQRIGTSNVSTDNERALLSQFSSQPIVRDYNTILAKKLSVDQIIDSGVGGPGDLAVVYEFMRGLDPNSVVRETEYATAAKSGNIFAGVFARFNGYFKESGGFLPENVKSAFKSIINSKLDVQQKLYDNTVSEYKRIAKQQGLNPENVVINFGGAFQGLLTSPDGTEQVNVSDLTPDQIKEAKQAGWK